MSSWEVIAVQLSLLVIVIVISVGGNAIIGALLIRFKNLRTIPNILIANMALIDLMNSVTNMPLTVVIHVLGWQHTLKSKALTFAVGSLYALFFDLNVFSMILLAADRYGAIVYSMPYMLWKTRRKAYVGVALVWSLSFVFTAVNYVPFLYLDIPNGTVADYRRAQFKTTGRYTTLVKIPLVILLFGILTVLTWYTMSQARKKLPGIQDLSAQIRQKREMNDLKATKTLIIAFVMFCLTYLPTIIYSVVVKRGVWFGFFGMFSPFVSSACNPIIYALRTRRFRHAIKQLCKDPCGKSPLQELRDARKPPPLIKNCVTPERNDQVPKLNSDEGSVKLEVSTAAENINSAM